MRNIWKCKISSLWCSKSLPETCHFYFWQKLTCYTCYNIHFLGLSIENNHLSKLWTYLFHSWSVHFYRYPLRIWHAILWTISCKYVRVICNKKFYLQFFSFQNNTEVARSVQQPLPKIFSPKIDFRVFILQFLQNVRCWAYDRTYRHTYRDYYFIHISIFINTLQCNTKLHVAFL